MENNNGNSQELSNNKRGIPFMVFFKDARHILKLDSLSREILGIAFPAALAVVADPIASLIDTTFIGHLGPLELAAAGVSIAVFNQASRITIFPLVSITTSFVAEEDTIKSLATTQTENDNTKLDRPIVSKDHMLPQTDNVDTPKELTDESNNVETKSSNVEQVGTGNMDMNNGNENVMSKRKKKVGKKVIASASTALIFGTILGLLQTAILSFAAKPLLYAMGLKHVHYGNHPPYIVNEKSAPPTSKHEGFADFQISQKWVVSVTFCMTLASSLAARLGSIPMAAFQPGLQIWLASSLLADGLAVAVQTILACSFAEKDYHKATAAATRTLQMTFLLGFGLSLAVALGLFFGAPIFSKNATVVQLIKISMPVCILYNTKSTSKENLLHARIARDVFVAATQPINSLAFVFDGVNYGASDFAYSAYSLASFGVISEYSYRNLSLQKQTIYWNMDCIKYIHDSSYGSWYMEDGNWNRTMVLS
ncbi:Protein DETOXIFICATION 42 [Vigna angularis]|uniref:Protein DETOXIFICATION n=1 Tax=Phaseolus angularis TaxID=3914 RepID=A0A8T0K9K8_PHAAN|nr:Protein DETOXIFICATION 42 [Vigna angularis]